MASPSRFLAQRNQIIMEIGSALTKVGFAGDAGPLAIVPSVGNISDGQTVDLFAPMKYSKRLEAVLNFMKDIYTKNLLSNPKERKVVILLNPFEIMDLEKALLHTLLNLLEVPSVSFVAPHMTIFPAMGVLHTGLIVDIGNSTRIIPVAQNAAIVGAWNVLPNIGFAGLVRYVRTNLLTGCTVVRSRAYNMDTGDTTCSDTPANIEDICQEIDFALLCQDLVDRWLACTSSARSRKLLTGEEYSESFRPFPNLKQRFYTGGQIHDVVLSGRFLEEAMETLFRPNIDGQSLATAILDVILKCPVDLRRAMIGNIMVVGGFADVKNLLSRLNAELYITSKEPEFLAKVPSPDFRFVHLGKIPPNIVAWRGCSVLIQANYFPDFVSFTREDLILHGSGNNVSQLLKEWCFVGKDRRITR